ncbi:unnamed protein product [Coccothraustes coccothraustes]
MSLWGCWLAVPFGSWSSSGLIVSSSTFAEPWDGEARASRRSGLFEVKFGTARQERAAGAASSRSRVERRGKSEPQERPLRGQEWNGEARASRRSGLFEVKFGTARQERAAGAASSSSRLERRGKSEPQERPLRAQEWNGEARASALAASSSGIEEQASFAQRARLPARRGTAPDDAMLELLRPDCVLIDVCRTVGRRGKSEPQERPLRGQEWDGEARASRRSGLFEVKFGTARQERAAGAASSSSRLERRGKSEPQERPLRAQDWNGEARASALAASSSGIEEQASFAQRARLPARRGTAPDDAMLELLRPDCVLIDVCRTVGRRGKSEPQERPLRGQEWNGEARASRRSGLFEVKSGTARQERAAGAASSRSSLERRGKREPQERPLRAQDWNGEARASRRSGLFELKTGTARQERAAGAASSSSRVERRGKSEPQERPLRAQEWNGEARASALAASSSGIEEQASFAQRARLPARRGTAPDDAMLELLRPDCVLIDVCRTVGRRGKGEPQERPLRGQVWNGEARASRRSGLFEVKSGTARQERAAGAASSRSSLERRGKREPQERPLRAQDWNGEARASRRSGLFELKTGTARQELQRWRLRAQELRSKLELLRPDCVLIDVCRTVGRRGKSEPQERPLRGQEWNGEARASRRSGLFEVKSGTARQERAAGAASSRSSLERRGKSEPQERPLRAQDWNGEARASRRSGLFELKSGTARQELQRWRLRAQELRSKLELLRPDCVLIDVCRTVGRRGKSEPQERPLRGQVWNGEARASRRSGLFEVKSGTARQERAAGAASSRSRVERRGKREPQERPLRAQDWNGEARASRRSGLFEVKSGTARQELQRWRLRAQELRSKLELLRPDCVLIDVCRTVGRRGKSEPQERPLRGQEWNGEARASRRSGLFELKTGTARQERAAGAASSRSRVERRGKSFSVGGFELRN